MTVTIMPIIIITTTTSTETVVPCNNIGNLPFLFFP